MATKFSLDTYKKVWKCFSKNFSRRYLMYSTLLSSVGNVFSYLKLIDEEIALEAFIRKKVCTAFDFWKKD